MLEELPDEHGELRVKTDVPLICLTPRDAGVKGVWR